MYNQILNFYFICNHILQQTELYRQKNRETEKERELIKKNMCIISDKNRKAPTQEMYKQRVFQNSFRLSPKYIHIYWKRVQTLLIIQYKFNKNA